MKITSHQKFYLLMLANVKEAKDLQSQGNAKAFFQTTLTNVDIYREPMSRKLVGFHQYPIDVENCKCGLSWWHKNKTSFQPLLY
jgi:hypothetical protein